MRRRGFAGRAAAPALILIPSLILATAGSATAQTDWRDSPTIDAALAAAPQGAALRECDACPELVSIPGGVFTMGSPPDEEGRDVEEGPPREVVVAPFLMARTEVTVGEFRRFVEATSRDMSGGCNYLDDEWTLDQALGWDSVAYEQTEAHPVSCVSVADAEAYAAWISQQPGVDGVYRLPTEAEFEFAARAGSSAPFPWGARRDVACAFANVGDASSVASFGWDPTVNFACDDGFVYPAPVGSLKPNAFGLYDMIGNLSEVVADCWAPSHEGGPTTGEARRFGLGVDCLSAPVRGGAWASLADYTRSAARVSTPRDYRTDLDGFRLARDLNAE